VSISDQCSIFNAGVSFGKGIETFGNGCLPIGINSVVVCLLTGLGWDWHA